MASNSEDFCKAVEPLANRDGQSFDACMLASIAISLKRIADEIQGSPTHQGISLSLFRISEGKP